jgi:hypothetical protein
MRNVFSGPAIATSIWGPCLPLGATARAREVFCMHERVARFAKRPTRQILCSHAADNAIPHRCVNPSQDRQAAIVPMIDARTIAPRAETLGQTVVYVPGEKIVADAPTDARMRYAFARSS